MMNDDIGIYSCCGRDSGERADETRQRRRAGVGLLLHATYGTCSLIRSPIKTSPMQAGHVPGLDPGHDRHD